MKKIIPDNTEKDTVTDSDAKKNRVVCHGLGGDCRRCLLRLWKRLVHILEWRKYVKQIRFISWSYNQSYKWGCHFLRNLNKLRHLARADNKASIRRSVCLGTSHQNKAIARRTVHARRYTNCGYVRNPLNRGFFLFIHKKKRENSVPRGTFYRWVARLAGQPTEK